MKKMLWGVVIFCGVIGGLNLYNAYALAESSPQQAAGAALACAWAVCPYVIARAVSEMTKGGAE